MKGISLAITIIILLEQNQTYIMPKTFIESSNDLFSRIQNEVKKANYQLIFKENNRVFTGAVQNAETSVVTLQYEENQTLFGFLKYKKGHTNGHLTITGLNNRKIEKHFAYYYKEEMELQGAIFKEIVSKLGHVDLMDENANKKYDLVLMEDIRNYIVKNAPSNLSTEYSVDVIQNHVEVKLISAENTLMFMKNYMKEQSGEYFIIMEVTVVIEGEEVTKEFKIKMFTQDTDDFETVMKEVMGLVSLKQYSNNAVQHYLVLKSFFNERKDGIDVQQLGSSTNEIKFKLSFERKEIYGIIQYIPNKDDSLLGGHQMKFYQANFELEKNIVRNFGFRRMSIERLKALFITKGIHEIFLEMHEEIAKIFRECYNEILYPVKKQSLSAQETRPYLMGFFGQTCSKQTNQEVLDFSVCPDPADDGFVNINLEFKVVNSFRFQQKFPKQHYQRDLVTEYFRFLLKDHLRMHHQKFKSEYK